MSEGRMILADGLELSNEQVQNLPNENFVVVGGTGTGKTVSIFDPNLINTKGSGIAIYAKEENVYRFAEYFESIGYYAPILNLVRPENSTIGYDPLQYVESYDDITNLSSAIVNADPQYRQSTADPYWNKSAVQANDGVTGLAMARNKEASYTDVLELFDSMRIDTSGSLVSTSLDGWIDHLANNDPNSFIVRSFRSFTRLPVRTAGCVYDTLSTALHEMFPESIRQLMRNRRSINIEMITYRPTMLFVITSPLNLSTYRFANLFMAQVITQLSKCAQRREDHKLPRPVKLYFDDFAASPILGFDQSISIFRSIGISAMLLLQSESQLENAYGPAAATTIINNCSTYVYLTGGMDLKTAQSISTRLNRPLEDVLYAPLGKVFVFQPGRKPFVGDRYKTLEDEQYISIMRRDKPEKSNDGINR